YKNDSSNVSSEANALFSLSFSKKCKKTLNINRVFNKPKTPPKILFINPNPEKSAILVNTFASNVIPITTAINVITKAIISKCFQSLEKVSRSISAVQDENFIAIKIPTKIDTDEARDTKNPSQKPRIKPKSRKASKIISDTFMFIS